MENMIREYFKMKRYEIKAKTLLYKSLIDFANEKKDLFETAKMVYVNIKGLSQDDIYKGLLHEMAIVIDENSKKEEAEKDKK